jgi:3-oxoadipate enol-lactonase
MTELAFSIRGRESDPLIVLGPPLGGSIAVWDDTTAILLEQGYRVACFDHWGHGRSPDVPGPFAPAALADDILRVADAVREETFSYAGVSLGGSLGLVLAAIAPTRVRSLVVISTLPAVGKPDDWKTRAQAVEHAGSVAALGPALFARWLTPGYPARAPHKVQRLRYDLAATSPDAYAAYCRMAGDMNLAALLERVTTPTLVISGAEDSATPAAEQARMADGIPRARHVVIAGAAHLVCVEAAPDVARLVAEHSANG